MQWDIVGYASPVQNIVNRCFTSVYLEDGMREGDKQLSPIVDPCVEGVH